MLKTIVVELRLHAPFTLFGAVTGILLVIFISTTGMSRELSTTFFWGLHLSHVFLSAVVTAGLYRLQGNRGVWQTLLVGYFGSVGIATLSDSVIPFIGEVLLDLPNRGLHLGVVEQWKLVTPVALLGIASAFFQPTTRLPHAGHVLLSTWASLFHIVMAMGAGIAITETIVIAVFLFLAVWVPCCTSDIVFPLLFSRVRSEQPKH
ncbi:hypothetical protein [Teredinibacter haidensis]|uniref:hypothetical protein n=1 Tax=Teredinibacter haidensis TaxID=2731755 RepID=UPI0009490302|nr:hypothetical protein [Teredinibacter haidensis]